MSSEIIAWVVGKTRVVVAWLFSASSYSAWGKDAALVAARQQAAEEMEEETLHLNTITTTVLTYLSYAVRPSRVCGWLAGPDPRRGDYYSDAKFFSRFSSLDRVGRTAEQSAAPGGTRTLVQLMAHFRWSLCSSEEV